MKEIFKVGDTETLNVWWRSRVDHLGVLQGLSFLRDQLLHPDDRDVSQV